MITGNRIPHVPSLPVDELYDGSPVVAHASPSAMPGPSSATPSTSSDSQAVHSFFSEENAADSQ